MSKKIPKEKIAEDIKAVNEEIDKPITQEYYKEHGEYSIYPIKSIWGTWQKAKDELGLEKATGKIPKEKLIEDIKRVREEKGYFNGVNYNKEGKYSTATLQLRFGSIKEAAEKAGIETTKDKILEKTLKAFEKYLSDKRGRLRFEKLKNEVRDEHKVKIQPLSSEKYIDTLNKRDNGLTITKGSEGGPTGFNIFIENENVGMYDKFIEELPEGTIEIFKEVMSQTDKSPQGVVAGIRYIYGKEKDSGYKQEDATTEHCSSTVTVRRNRDMLKEKGYAEDIKQVARQGVEIVEEV